MAGPGLREICDTVGIPPVLHSGSCVDNFADSGRLLRDGARGRPWRRPERPCPSPAARPKWMSEKAVAIGNTSSPPARWWSSAWVCPSKAAARSRIISPAGIAKELGGRWAIEPDPKRMAQVIREHIESKRDALGINEKKERKLFDMADRRELKV